MAPPPWRIECAGGPPQVANCGSKQTAPGKHNEADAVPEEGLVAIVLVTHLLPHLCNGKSMLPKSFFYFEIDEA
jgi:hypothetical protein